MACILLAILTSFAVFRAILTWPKTIVAVCFYVLFCNSVFIFLVFREILGVKGPNATAAIVSIAPASIFAIFWMYMMLRLPTSLAALCAISFVMVVLTFSFYSAPFSVVFRQAMYYFVALASGHVMSTLTEKRERMLFLQRRLLLSAKKSAEEALAKVEEARREKNASSPRSITTFGNQ